MRAKPRPPGASSSRPRLAARDDRPFPPGRLFARLAPARFVCIRFSAMRSNVPSGSPVLRFAPSPNGLLHLGHAYSALCNERIAKEMNGRLLLRIEDLDRTRCKPLYEAAIARGSRLAWPSLRRPAAPAERTRGRLRRCARPPGWARACLSLLLQPGRDRAGAQSAAIPTERRSIRAPAGRFPRAPSRCGRRGARSGRCGSTCGARAQCAPVGLVWTEFGEGTTPVEQAAEPARWGDVVLRGRDLAASYHLAVTVDDALQGVTDVVRGRDLLAATSVHRLLQALLEPARAALSPPSARARRRRGETVEAPSVAVAGRAARKRRLPGSDPRGARIRRRATAEAWGRAQLSLAVVPAGAKSASRRSSRRPRGPAPSAGRRGRARA